MLRNKHQEDSTDGRVGNNGLEAMISSFGLQRSESKLKQVKQKLEQQVKFKMDFLVYGMEI